MSTTLDLLVNKIGWQIAFYMASDLRASRDSVHLKIISLLDMHFQPELNEIKKHMADGWAIGSFSVTRKSMTQLYTQAYVGTINRINEVNGNWISAKSITDLKASSVVLTEVWTGEGVCQN